MHWYLISESNGKTIQKYFGCLSKQYPIALLCESCPNNIKDYILHEKILIDEYRDRYSCEKKVLKQYVNDVIMLDDRFLYNESFPFDDEVFLEIDEGIQYINSYDFSFESIK